MGIDGLSIPPIRAEYMTQYRNNLIGKHFKTLMQTLPFHIHGLVTPNQFALVKAVSALSPMLWVDKIEDMNQYLVRFSLFYMGSTRIFLNNMTRMILKYLSEMCSIPLATMIPPRSSSR